MTMLEAIDKGTRYYNRAVETLAKDASYTRTAGGDYVAGFTDARGGRAVEIRLENCPRMGAVVFTRTIYTRTAPGCSQTRRAYPYAI